MVLLKGSVLCVVSALSLALAAPASEATIGVSGKLIVGEQITITYSNPEFAGEMIWVWVVSGGIGEEGVEGILIQLDEQGEGQNVWEVADWHHAIFSAPGVEDVASPIRQLH